MIPLAYLDWPDDVTTTTSTSTSTTTTGTTNTPAPTGTTETPTNTGTPTPTTTPQSGIWYTYCGNVGAGYPPGTVVGPVFEAGGNCTTRFNQLNNSGDIGSGWNCAPGDSNGSSVAPANCPTSAPTTEAPTNTGTPTPTPTPTTSTTTTTAPCNCSQFDNQCPPGFTATCNASCQFTGVCFG